MAVSKNGNSLADDPNRFDWAIQQELAQWIKMTRLDKGEQIYTPDRIVDHFHLLWNGLLGIYKQIPPDKSLLVGKVHPGRTIGLTQLFLGTSFPAHVRAIKGSILLRGDSEDLETIGEKYPDQLTGALLEESFHYSSIYERIQNILSEDVEQKIARELLDLADQIGRDTSRGLEIVVGLTRKDISNMVGCAHETASRVMSQWETDEIISTDHKNITLRNSAKLESKLAPTLNPS